MVKNILVSSTLRDDFKIILPLLRSELVFVNYLADNEINPLNILRLNANLIFLFQNSDRNGSFDICKQIKSNPYTRKTRIIIIRNISQEKIESPSEAIYIDNIFYKPLRPVELLNSIMDEISPRINSERIAIKSNEKNESILYLDRDNYTASIDNKNIPLSRKEFELIQLLASRKGKVFRREELFNKVWNKTSEFENRTLDVHIRRIRKKMGHNLIVTKKGIGYMLNVFEN
ncbi:MAG: DNA-binding response regulator [Bacteroidetes bacterium]|nr:MAG: DNA-binding response regulator [Bacteroidota bacterium]REJ99821.1 MAG: DNA-binding response regulator [Bacteroidota bacterium]REK34194.1 MAG: DNA-binding response regulator [Bacteroidota bacterium]REK50524.1 MAG: DNA-binding response regulator [Bacteroidota bacterium]